MFDDPQLAEWWGQVFHELDGDDVLEDGLGAKVLRLLAYGGVDAEQFVQRVFGTNDPPSDDPRYGWYKEYILKLVGVRQDPRPYENVDTLRDAVVLVRQQLAVLGGIDGPATGAGRESPEGEVIPFKEAVERLKKYRVTKARFDKLLRGRASDSLKGWKDAHAGYRTHEKKYQRFVYWGVVERMLRKEGKIG